MTAAAVRRRSWWPRSRSVQALQFLTRLLWSPFALAHYTDEQIAQGLWYLFDSSCSDYMGLLREPQVPTDARRRCIEGIVVLNRDCFRVRCAPESDNFDGSPLSITCYMLWDLSEALEPQLSDPEIDAACLNALSETLELEHPLCQKAALHGLGHWAEAYSEQVKRIIDKFLAEHVLDPALRAFAIGAREGNVP